MFQTRLCPSALLPCGKLPWQQRLHTTHCAPRNIVSVYFQRVKINAQNLILRRRLRSFGLYESTELPR
jgi:hypothetical protein